MQKDLWRIEDVTAGLSANKSNYKVIIESIKNPGKINTMQTFRAASGSIIMVKCVIWQTCLFPSILPFVVLGQGYYFISLKNLLSPVLILHSEHL